MSAHKKVWDLGKSVDSTTFMIPSCKRGTAAVEGKAQSPVWIFLLHCPFWNKSFKALRGGGQRLLPLGYRPRPSANRVREPEKKWKWDEICSEARPLKIPGHWGG